MLLFSNHAISFSLQSHTPLHVSRCTSPFKGGRARAPRRGLNTAPPRWRQKSGWASLRCPMRMTECCCIGFDPWTRSLQHAGRSLSISEDLCLWRCFHLMGIGFCLLAQSLWHTARFHHSGVPLPVKAFLPYGVSFCLLAQTKPEECCPILLPSRSTSAHGSVSHYGKRFRSCLKFVSEDTER